MAPSCQPVPALQGTRRRPTTIVPAIPLPFTQKRKQPTAVVADNRERSSEKNGVVETKLLPSTNGIAHQLGEGPEKPERTLRIKTSEGEESQRSEKATTKLSRIGTY